MSDPSKKRTIDDTYSRLLEQIDEELQQEPQRSRVRRDSPPPARPAIGYASQGSSQESADPESRCGICYSSIETRGVLDTCEHRFCFECITHWAQTENTCPVCKLRFATIRSVEQQSTADVQRSAVTRVPERTQDPTPIGALTRRQAQLPAFTNVFLELMRAKELQADDPRIRQLPAHLVSMLQRTKLSIPKLKEAIAARQPGSPVRLHIAAATEPIRSTTDASTTTRTRTYLDLTVDEDDPSLVTGVWTTVTTSRTPLVLDLTGDDSE